MICEYQDQTGVERQLPLNTPNVAILPEVTKQMYHLAVQAVTTERDRTWMAVEYERLKVRMDRKQAEEDAYSKIFQCEDVTWVMDSTKRWVELLNRQVEWALHIVPDGPLEQQPVYVIQLKGVEQTLLLTEKEFLQDAVLIQRLQELAGVQVRLCRSVKRTAFLLRKAISASEYVLPFYGGWGWVDGEIVFRTFQQSATHRAENSLVCLEEITPLDVEYSDQVMVRFREMLSAVADSNIRWLFKLWFHAAALTSLLEYLGFPMTLALCVCATGSAWAEWVGMFFGWFGDAAISLDVRPETFSKMLLQRKDQPLLVFDGRKSPYAAANAERLERVLTSKEVLSKKGTVALQSLPVIFSPLVTSLSCSPSTIVIELEREGLKLPDETLLGGWEFVKNRCWMFFIVYVQKHMAQLSELLAQYTYRINVEYEELVDVDCARTFAVLLALDDFLEGFYGKMCAAESADGDEKRNWLLKLLEQTAWKSADGCGLVDRFISVARAQLTCGTLTVCSINDQVNTAARLVIYDSDNLYFNSNALRSVCAQLNQSRPVVLRALGEVGVLHGKPINGTTVMTRIGVKNSDGNCQTLSVYRMRREAFDRFGDPLFFEEEFG